MDTAHAAADRRDTPICLVESVISGVLTDEGFTLPTEESKLCLQIATSLSEAFSQRSRSCLDHSKWLVEQLSKLIDKAKKRGSHSLNEERLWSTYHQLCSSDTFEEKWERFLVGEKLAKEPLFYQYITDQTFELLIKNKLPTNEQGCTSVDQEKLTFEEENAVRYVGGYVIRQLMHKSVDGGVKQVLSELIDTGACTAEGPAQEWVNAIDRGGLTKITTEAYRLFYAIEMCARRHLITDNPKILENIKDTLQANILQDSDVLFYWCLAGQIEGDEVADKSLAKIADLWITIRANSFAKNILEMYKQNNKKGTEKAKSLRSTLCT